METKKSNLISNTIAMLNRNLRSLPILLGSIFGFIALGKLSAKFLVNISEELFFIPLSASFIFAGFIPRIILGLEEKIRSQSMDNADHEVTKHVQNKANLLNIQSEDLGHNIDDKEIEQEILTKINSNEEISNELLGKASPELKQKINNFKSQKPAFNKKPNDLISKAQDDKKDKDTASGPTI